jgi:hypothetical protein
MTIGKKLYLGFGSVLIILLALLAVNIVAGFKEKSARALPDHAEPSGPEQFPAQRRSPR